MREVDPTCVGGDVVAGAEMAACEWWGWQLYRPFDNDAVVPIETYGNAVQLSVDAVGTQTETVVVRGLSLGIPMRRSSTKPI